MPFFADGFESGTLGAWTTVKGLTVSTTAATGSFGARATSTGGATYARKTFAGSYGEVYARTRFQVLGQGASIACLLKLRSGSKTVIDLCLDKGGALYSWNYASRTKTVSATKVLPGSGWHDLQLRVVVGTSSRSEVWLDGVLLADLTTTADLGTAAVNGLQLGGDESSKSYDLAFDDVAVATRRIEA